MLTNDEQASFALLVSGGTPVPPSDESIAAAVEAHRAATVKQYLNVLIDVVLDQEELGKESEPDDEDAKVEELLGGLRKQAPLATPPTNDMLHTLALAASSPIHYSYRNLSSPTPRMESSSPPPPPRAQRPTFGAPRPPLGGALLFPPRRIPVRT